MDVRKLFQGLIVNAMLTAEMSDVQLHLENVPVAV